MTYKIAKIAQPLCISPFPTLKDEDTLAANILCLHMRADRTKQLQICQSHCGVIRELSFGASLRIGAFLGD